MAHRVNSDARCTIITSATKIGGIDEGSSVRSNLCYESVAKYDFNTAPEVSLEGARHCGKVGRTGGACHVSITRSVHCNFAESGHSSLLPAAAKISGVNESRSVRIQFGHKGIS